MTRSSPDEFESPSRALFLNPCFERFRLLGLRGTMHLGGLAEGLASPFHLLDASCTRKSGGGLRILQSSRPENQFRVPCLLSLVA